MFEFRCSEGRPALSLHPCPGPNRHCPGPSHPDIYPGSRILTQQSPYQDTVLVAVGLLLTDILILEPTLAKRTMVADSSE